MMASAKTSTIRCWGYGRCDPLKSQRFSLEAIHGKLVTEMAFDPHNFPAFPVPQISKNTGMSLRVYAAIHLQVADSGIPWLDEMIRTRVMQPHHLRTTLSPAE